ncbi:MAG TPA: DUF2298 domain-containing protein [Mobilitalea sp.]|nr:DUF2298 domain-containing protein [Mobilitalea sp.]
MLKKLMYSVSAIIVLIWGKYLLGEDLILLLQWWAIIMCLGLIFMPLTNLLFSSFADKGILFSKTIGIACSGYIMWLFSSLHILKFNERSCLITVVITLLINVTIILVPWLRAKIKHNGRTLIKSLFQGYGRENIEVILTEEILFLAIFIFFVYVRGFNPEIFGTTEKFMDYGFMTTIARSDYMPPQDFWLSGTALNYYYVGQFMATFLSKLSFVGTSVGYNLMLMMIGAFTVMLPYSLAYNMILYYRRDRKQKKGILPAASGVLAGAAVCIAGNMHYPIYKWLVPAYQKYILKATELYSYWFPAATRYIGYNPDTTDKTIHEFPAYSFVLGDLHAHVINILFVLTLLGILLGWLHKRPKINDERPSLKKEIFNPFILMLGLLIGLFHTTNYWDFYIYYVVSGAIILFSNMIVYNFKGKAYWLTGIQGVIILVLGELFCLPFTLNFNKMSGTPIWAEAHTPIYQLLVLWGLPIITVLAFLIFMAGDFALLRNRSRKKTKKKKQKERISIVLFMQGLNSSDLFILTIGLCAIGLILLPELVYIEDIYSGDYKRANTMFKLTYQAFIMFGICLGYILIRLLAFGRTKHQKVMAGVLLFLFSLSLFYVGNATKAWFGDISDKKGYEGIDSTAFMELKMPEDDLATKWLNENVEGTPVVLEANGDSYTAYQRVSVITGLPTPLGWYNHERLWKSEPDTSDIEVTAMLNKRAEDIKTIYTSLDEETVSALLQEYKVSYIYVGGLELKKYEIINHELIKSLGTVVFEIPTTATKNYETYIVKIE